MTSIMQPPDRLDWAQLYTEYAGKIHNYLYHRSHDADLADDLTSSTFVKALEASQRGYGSRSNFSGWLYGIARNLLIDHFRAIERHESVDLDDALADPTISPVRSAEHNEDAAMLESLLCQLTPLQAQAIRLRYYEGMSCDEIGKIIGTNANAVRRLRFTGLTKMCELLGAKRIVRPDGCKLDAIRSLQEHGPQTLAQLSNRTGASVPALHILFNRHPDLFAVVDKRKSATIMVNVWGLRQHD